MNENQSNLSVAFYWHMHQPVYELGGMFLMPWVRLHAVKDYIDMINILEKYPRLKLNVNVVPALLDELIYYADEGYNDIHSSLTLTPVEDLSESEKEYILNNFFNAKYETMIYKYPTYRKLFKKRHSSNKIKIDDFSEQEYSDLMALFNLVWIDSAHYKNYPEIVRLVKKGKNYTLRDRIKIIDLQRNIIKELIPTYKKYISQGRLELTTSPYYHPIMPVLCDYENIIKNVQSDVNLPVDCDLQEDAHNQVRLALSRIEEVFGVRPKGMWPSELCLTNKVLELYKDEGIKWTISDETILAKSINFEFIRDFKGNLEDPYYLLKTYTYNSDNTGIDVIFRDSQIASLINFEYSNVDQTLSANDLFNKIKAIQNKLLVSPDENHLLTIALDGENCWENYQNDGSDFLETIYSKLGEDETVETVLISDYLSRDKNKKNLNNIYPGSWINKGFSFWIGDPVKNLALKYLTDVRNDVLRLLSEMPDIDKLQVLKELYIAEGSDWFWWYGEPNNSGQDNVFDYLFREHLKNAYKNLGENYPQYLDNSIIEKASEESQLNISDTSYIKTNLLYSNSIDLIDGPVFQETKIFDTINYGYDRDNIYFQISLNPNFREKDNKKPKIHQFYIYTRPVDKKQTLSNIRVLNKTEAIFPILKSKYHNELMITLFENTIYPSILSKATSDNLWSLMDAPGVNIVQNKKIDICLPFDEIDVAPSEKLEVFFVIGNLGIRNMFMPKDTPILLKRPE